MSGWIKWEKDLETDPRVLRMSRELKRICNAGALHPVTLVCGGLIRLWSYADSHAREDDTLDLGVDEIDELVGIPGFCSIMPADWLREIDEHTVELPNFQQHGGTEAKKKALTKKRVETHRKRSSVTGALTNALPDQDQDQDQDQTKTTQRPAPSVSGVRGIGLPVGLNADAFDRWEQYQRLNGRPLNDLSRPAAQRKLVAMGDPEVQAATVEHCIANGWKTLNPVRVSAVAATTLAQRKPRKTADELEAECRARGEDPYALN